LRKFKLPHYPPETPFPALNLCRRHMSETLRSDVAAKLANRKVGRNWQESNSANLQNNPVSQSAAATLLNVSERSVRSAVAVRAHGVLELVEAVERAPVRGQGTIPALHREPSPAARFGAPYSYGIGRGV
jgi:hypothetical protein